MNQAKRSIDEIEPEAPPVEEQPSLVWTPEMVKDVEAFIENLADRYLQFKKDEAGADQRYLEETAKTQSAHGLCLNNVLGDSYRYDEFARRIW